MYKIPSCGKVYIEETGRKISTWIKEYQRYKIWLSFSITQLTEHWMKTSHVIWQNQHTGSFTRLSYSKSLKILKHSDNLNRDKDYQMNSIWHTARFFNGLVDQLKYFDWLKLESPFSSFFDQSEQGQIGEYIRNERELRSRASVLKMKTVTFAKR